jgi:hypothetical protein
MKTKVSIKTVVFHPSENVTPKWQWGLVVKGGNKHAPSYTVTLYNYGDGHSTRKEALRTMKQADQAVRFQFRTRGRMLRTSHWLRLWWGDWSRAKAGQPRKKSRSGKGLIFKNI